MWHRQIALLIDLDRCIGCRGCQVACKSEHTVALGANRINVRQVGPFGDYPDLQMYFLPRMCQQCAEPECVSVCPTGACRRSDADGVVAIDPEMCIGCRSCEKACPFDANDYNHELKVMDKCDICRNRRNVGLGPACARNCPGSAIFWGDAADPHSEVSKLIKDAGDAVYCLGEGTEEGEVKTNTRYILRKAVWQRQEGKK